RASPRSAGGDQPDRGRFLLGDGPTDGPRRPLRLQPPCQPARGRVRPGGTGAFDGRPCRPADEGMTMDEQVNEDVKAMSFEQALEALEKIVDDLERGDVPLDQSIRIYERGEALKAHCDRLLKAAEDRVEKIRLSRDGKPVGVEPLDGE